MIQHLPGHVARTLRPVAEKLVINRREPDLHLQGYMRRWYLLPRNRWANVYLHEFYGSDEPRLHDHPWHSLSFTLCGLLWEEDITGASTPRWAGNLVYRSPQYAHRFDVTLPTLTVFATGPRVRRWGFLPRGCWTPWGPRESVVLDQ